MSQKDLVELVMELDVCSDLAGSPVWCSSRASGRGSRHAHRQPMMERRRHRLGPRVGQHNRYALWGWWPGLWKHVVGPVMCDAGGYGARHRLSLDRGRRIMGSHSPTNAGASCRLHFLAPVAWKAWEWGGGQGSRLSGGFSGSEET